MLCVFQTWVMMGVWGWFCQGPNGRQQLPRYWSWTINYIGLGSDWATNYIDNEIIQSQRRKFISKTDEDDENCNKFAVGLEYGSDALNIQTVLRLRSQTR